MKRLSLTVVTILVAASAVSLFLAREQLAEFLYRETVSSGSESLFLGVQDAADLETVAVVHKTVFPHDFFHDETNFYLLLDRVRRADAPAREVLTPQELNHFNAVNLADSLGLAVAPGQTGYVVVTTTLRYGYDLSELEEVIRNRSRPGEQDNGSLSPISVPPARLLSHETEDLSRDDYPYSPVYLDAEGWQAVAGFVSTHLRRGDPDAEIIAQASSIGVELLEILTDHRFEVAEPE